MMDVHRLPKSSIELCITFGLRCFFGVVRRSLAAVPQRSPSVYFPDLALRCCLKTVVCCFPPSQPAFPTVQLAQLANGHMAARKFMQAEDWTLTLADTGIRNGAPADPERRRSIFILLTAMSWHSDKFEA